MQEEDPWQREEKPKPKVKELTIKLPTIQLPKIHLPNISRYVPKIIMPQIEVSTKYRIPGLRRVKIWLAAFLCLFSFLAGLTGTSIFASALMFINAGLLFEYIRLKRRGH